MSGTVGGFPQSGYFTGITTPLLATHGDRDETIAYSSGRSSWVRANSPKYFLTILGGSHDAGSHGGSTAAAKVQTTAFIAFLDAYLRGDRAARTRLGAAGNTPGVSTLVARP